MASTLLGVTDAAHRLNCSAQRVRQLADEGKLPAEKTQRGQRIFKAEDVEALRSQRERQRQARNTPAELISE